NHQTLNWWCAGASTMRATGLVLQVHTFYLQTGGAGNSAYRKSAIPQPMGQGCSKRHGSLEMPALRAEGEIRDERFWPERGKNQGIGHTAVAGSYRRADSKLRGRAVPKVNGADHGDRADGMKSWEISAAITLAQNSLDLPWRRGGFTLR